MLFLLASFAAAQIQPELQVMGAVFYCRLVARDALKLKRGIFDGNTRKFLTDTIPSS